MKDEIIIRQNDKITKYKSSKKVVAGGNGAIVYVPKELIGKTIEVKFEAKNE